MMLHACYIRSQAKLDGVVNTLLADRGSTPETMEKELEPEIQETKYHKVRLRSTGFAPYPVVKRVFRAVR